MKTTKIILSILITALSVWLLIFDTNPSYNWLRFFVIVTLISIPVAYAFGSVEFRRKPKINIEPKLLKFLEEKGVLKEFMANYEKGKKWRKERGFPSYITNIAFAFSWSKNSQGVRYWYDLHIEFIDKQFKNK